VATVTVSTLTATTAACTPCNGRPTTSRSGSGHAAPSLLMFWPVHRSRMQLLGALRRQISREVVTSTRTSSTNRSSSTSPSAVTGLAIRGAIAVQLVRVFRRVLLSSPTTQALSQTCTGTSTPSRSTSWLPQLQQQAHQRRHLPVHRHQVPQARPRVEAAPSGQAVTLPQHI
jgi:hypothetical protein